MPRLLRLLGASLALPRRLGSNLICHSCTVFTGTATGFAMQCFRREIDVAQPRHFRRKPESICAASLDSGFRRSDER